MDKSRGPRLQKVLADAGVASRRRCEQLIVEGAVRVNGRVIESLPAFVDPLADRIEVEGELIPRPKRARKTRTRREAGVSAAAEPATGGPRHYLMLNKPRRVISTVEDELGRPTVLDLVRIEGGLPGKAKRLYPVGRLDAESTGLVLLTDDGELTRRLTHPSFEVSKRYRVSVRGRVKEADLEKLKQGILLAHRQSMKRIKVRRAAVARVERLGYERDDARGDRTQLAVTLREGQNREIRRILARLGFKVRRLHREAIGPLRLKGLASGQWRLLTRSEITKLHRAVEMAD